MTALKDWRILCCQGLHLMNTLIKLWTAFILSSSSWLSHRISEMYTSLLFPTPNSTDEFSDVKALLAQNKKPKFAREVLQDLCRAAQSNCEVSPNSMVLAISRVLVCKPHSSDCERIISAYNRLRHKLLVIICTWMSICHRCAVLIQDRQY